MEDAGCPNQWHITKVKILKRFGEAMRTPQQVEWYTGMEKEVKAMFLLGVLVPIDETEAPKNAAKLGLMWQFQVKTDDDGYITRFRPRIPKGQLYRVDRALCGLHQSGSEWNEQINAWLILQEFTNSETEPCLYVYTKAHASATPMETNAKYSKVIEESDEQDPTFNSENMKVNVSADTSPAVMNLCALEAS
uniref:Uncharacterized protein n=1 Tax=Hyaloperonospora arabidopsidis (strain Emoy2) TaxID=559515 RepID=M4BGH1_HYAAE